MGIEGLMLQRYKGFDSFSTPPPPDHPPTPTDSPIPTPYPCFAGHFPARPSIILAAVTLLTSPIFFLLVRVALAVISLGLLGCGQWLFWASCRRSMRT